MSDRSYHRPQTQGLQHVQYAFSATATGTHNPVMGEGDSSESYLQAQYGATGTVAHGFTGSAGGPSGMTGCVVFKTRDPFPAVVSKNISLEPGSGVLNGTLGWEAVKPIQDSDGRWNLGFYFYNVTTGLRVNLPNGTVISGQFVFRNTQTKP